MHPRFSTIRPFIISTGVLGTIFAGSITQAACVTAGTEKAPSETAVQDSNTRIERTIEVMVDGEDIQVMMNGRPLPAEQLREIDGAILIVDEDGTELERIHFGEVHGDPTEMPGSMLGVMMAENDRGVLVQGVIPGTPAAEAGLREGDLIVEANGRPVDTETLSMLVAGTRPGQPIDLTGFRDGQNFRGEIVLGRWDPDLMNDARNQNGDHHDERDIHREWNDDDDPGMAGIEAMIERLMMMVNDVRNQNGDHHDERDVHDERDIHREWNDDDDESGMAMIEAMVERVMMMANGDHHDERENVFHFRDEDDRGDEHAMEEMMREGRHQVEAWMHEMSEEASHWARDAEHQMHDFAEMFDARMGEMAAGFEQELHRIMERQDHGHRETEMRFRERDLQFKERGMILQQKLGESGQKLQETLKKFAEGHQRLAAQNRMLTERVERLEQALGRMMGDDRNSDATPRDQERMNEGQRRAERRRQTEERSQRAREAEEDRREAPERPRRQGGDRD